MKASKIVHKNENRIKIDFPYNQVISSKIKQIPGTRWSKTHTAWHIPYTLPAFEHLKILFPDTEYTEQVLHDLSIPDQRLSEATKENIPYEYHRPIGVSVMVLGRKISIKLPKNESDTKFILGLRYSRWDSKQYCWIVPNYPGNLDLIKDYFKERISNLLFIVKLKRI